MIEVGDIVAVNKDDAAWNYIKRAEVLHVPREPGDMWGFRDLDYNTEVWTNERIAIHKRNAA